MPQSLAFNLVHLIYSTKNREPLLTTEIRPKLFAYQAGIFKQWDSPAIVIGGVEDHVQALFLLSKNHTLIKVVEEVKKSSSKWIKAEGQDLESFHWQSGYGAFSVCPPHAPRVRAYIEGKLNIIKRRPSRRNSGIFWKTTRLSTTRNTYGTEMLLRPFRALEIWRREAQGVALG
jgi:putative transposase